MDRSPQAPLFALVDANNYYASAERCMRPSLNGRPIVVLSNNDGCCIARSNEAKELGIKMGAPWFEVKHLEESAGLVALSANFELYGEISDRVMSLAAGLGHRQEIYSIDESFLDMSGIRGDLRARAFAIRSRILQWVGIPCCVGIGPTKTLAKLANHVAKMAERKPGSYPAELAQVCNLASLTPPDMEQILRATPVGEVWGVGRRISKQLIDQGVATALDLARMEPAIARRGWSVIFERTVRELRGESCLDLEDIPPNKQEIACTRSFGRPVTELRDLIEAVSDFSSRAAEKLRRQNGVAGQVLVFIRTSPFRKTAQYSRSMVMPLRSPTSDTPALATAAAHALRMIYRTGFEYAKAGVMLLDLAPSSRVQLELAFDTSTDESGATAAGGAHRIELMRAVDGLNDRYGRGTLTIGARGTQRLSGSGRNWQMKQERRTPAYTTRWSDMPVVRA